MLIYIGNGIRFTKITPTKVVTKCPKKYCEVGQMDFLEPNNKTIDDPNVPAKNNPKVLLWYS